MAGPCTGVDPDTGKCDGTKVLYCSQVNGKDVLITIDCAQQPHMICAWDPYAGKYACSEEPCVPDCTNKECGDDGCFGKCGTCPVGWGCPAFHCRPVDGATCGFIPEGGYCWTDNWLYWCNGDPLKGGTVMSEDCNALGKVCTWVAGNQQYACL